MSSDILKLKDTTTCDLPVRDISFDSYAGYVVLLHTQASVVSFIKTNSKTKQLETVRIWKLEATCLTLTATFGYVITHPYASLLKVTRDGAVLEKMDIWDRYLTSLTSHSNYLFVCDSRNNAILQFDLNQPLNSETCLVFGMESLKYPCHLVMLNEYLTVTQTDGMISLMNYDKGNKIVSFGQPWLMLGRKITTCDPYLKLVFVCSSLDRMIFIYQMANKTYELKDPYFEQVTNFQVNYQPTSVTFDYISSTLYVLEQPDHSNGRIHRYTLSTGALSNKN